MTTQKTIVHLIPGLYLGGSEKVLELIYCHQISEGHSVYVITFEKSGFENFFSGLQIINCSVLYRDSLFNSKGIQIEEYEILIDKLKPDFIHSHSYWTDLISHYNLRKTINYITHFHLCYDFFDALKLNTHISLSDLFRWTDKWRLFKRYKAQNCAFLASSEFIASFYKKRFPAHLAARIQVMNNPIDARYCNIPKKEIKYDLLSIGRLESIKNHKFLLEIMRAMKERGMDFKLAIAGDGTLRNELEELRDVYKLNNHVFFLGPVKLLSELFSQSATYIHVSHAETFGLSIFEAMAAGLVVIVKKFEGMDEQLLIHQVNAVIIENENTEAFIKAIQELKSDSILRDRLMKNASATVFQLSEEEYLEEMDQFYLRIHG